MMAGLRFVIATPLQSVSLIFTGRTWPFLSLFVTFVFVMGGRNSPVPTLSGVAPKVAEAAPSLSVIRDVTVLQPGVRKLWVSVAGDELVVPLSVPPSEKVRRFAHSASAPGSVKYVRI